MARQFNGSSDHIDASGISFPITAITMSAWFNINTISPAQYEGVAVAAVGGAGIFAKSNATSVRTVPFYIPVTGGGGFVSYDPGAPGSSTWSLSTWTHALDTYDTTNGLNGYVNGILEGSAAANGNINFGAVSLGIGYDPNNAGRVVGGSVAEVAIWNVALSSLEISALAKGERPYTIRQSKLIFWSPLDGLQSPEPDLSGFKNNGILTGTSLGQGPPIAPFTPRWPRVNVTTLTPLAGLGWIINRRNKLMKPDA